MGYLSGGKLCRRLIPTILPRVAAWDHLEGWGGREAHSLAAVIGAGWLESADFVGLNLSVDGDNGQRFDLGLRDQKPIEGIGVDHGQRACLLGVLHADG